MAVIVESKSYSASQYARKARICDTRLQVSVYFLAVCPP